MPRRPAPEPRDGDPVDPDPVDLDPVDLDPVDLDPVDLDLVDSDRVDPDVTSARRPRRAAPSAGWPWGAAVRPARAPAWARTLAACVAVASVTGLLATHHERTRSGEQLALVTASLSLQLAFLDITEQETSVDPRTGWVITTVGVELVDIGPEPVLVTVTGLATPHQSTWVVPRRVQVSTTVPYTVLLTLAVDCSKVATPSDLSSSVVLAPAVSVRLRVRVGERSTGRLLPAPADVAGSFAQETATLCHPDAAPA